MEDQMKMEDQMNLPEHVCTTAGKRGVGFCPLDLAEMEKVLLNATGDQVKEQLKKWCLADAAKHPPLATEDSDAVQAAFRRALLSNAPFVVYCALCLEPICLMHPELHTEGQA